MRLRSIATATNTNFLEAMMPPQPDDPAEAKKSEQLQRELWAKGAHAQVKDEYIRYSSIVGLPVKKRIIETLDKLIRLDAVLANHTRKKEWAKTKMVYLQIKEVRKENPDPRMIEKLDNLAKGVQTESLLEAEIEDPEIAKAALAILQSVDTTDSQWRKTKKGSIQTEELLALQTILNQMGFDVGKADGWFGKRTARGVMAFQREHDLTVDGDPGKNTIAKMIEVANEFIGEEDPERGTVDNPKEVSRLIIGQLNDYVFKYSEEKYEELKDTHEVAFISDFGNRDRDNLLLVPFFPMDGTPPSNPDGPLFTSQGIPLDPPEDAEDSGLDTDAINKAIDSGDEPDKPEDDDEASKDDGAQDPEEPSSTGFKPNYNGTWRNDRDQFFQTEMTATDARELVQAQVTGSMSRSDMFDLRGEITRLIDRLNNGRIPTNSKYPRSGEIVRLPDTVDVLKRYRDGFLMDAIRRGAEEPETTTEPEEPEATPDTSANDNQTAADDAQGNATPKQSTYDPAKELDNLSTEQAIQEVRKLIRAKRYVDALAAIDYDMRIALNDEMYKALIRLADREKAQRESLEEKQIWARSGQKVVRKYRCTAGIRKGRIVSQMAQCFAAPDLKKRFSLKRTKARLGGRMVRKAKRTKRVNPASRRVQALNRGK